MAEAEAVGITSTGETGEGVKNELMDIIEKDKDTGEEKIIEKGINTYFKEFLKENSIVWGKK
ncbi:hypothetical protein [Campylobacter lari]|nr:hypothetical protein [Campylobacter lari]